MFAIVKRLFVTCDCRLTRLAVSCADCLVDTYVIRCALFVALHRACDLSIYPRVNALCRLALRFAVLVMLACFLLTYLNKREKTELDRSRYVLASAFHW